MAKATESQPDATQATTAAASAASPATKVEIPDHTKPMHLVDGRMAKDSAAPEDRVTFGRSARQRQLRSKPPRQPIKWDVQHGDESEIVEALDPDEAWAKFCDARRSYPSPAGRQVRRAQVLETTGRLLETATTPAAGTSRDL
jgi:hypothetical protein